MLYYEIMYLFVNKTIHIFNLFNAFYSHNNILSLFSHFLINGRIIFPEIAECVVSHVYRHSMLKGYHRNTCKIQNDTGDSSTSMKKNTLHISFIPHNHTHTKWQMPIFLMSNSHRAIHICVDKLNIIVGFTHQSHTICDQLEACRTPFILGSLLFVLWPVLFS